MVNYNTIDVSHAQAAARRETGKLKEA